MSYFDPADRTQSVLTPIQRVQRKNAEESAVFAESEKRAIWNVYSLLRLSARKWAVIRRRSVATFYLGVSDVAHFEITFQGKHDDCLAELKKLRG